jgi:hypothetical protein
VTEVQDKWQDDKEEEEDLVNILEVKNEDSPKEE